MRRPTGRPTGRPAGRLAGRPAAGNPPGRPAPGAYRLVARLAAVALAVGLVATVGVPAAWAAPAHAPIEGTGSSWSANAVNQWIADVNAQGLQVVFTSTGSAQGRKDYGYRTNDFAVTDIPFQGRDPVTGEDDSAQGRPYVYLPIVAGGTAFPYQVRVGGQLVRNLRLSGRTLAKIFTNQITNWNDPAITADNNGRVLPALTIIPVLHSEGSGSSAQFTRYLAKMYPDIWGPFNAGRVALTEYFPRKGQAVAQNGSDGVMNFIASAAANGAIGYDEYSYALNKNYPVAKVQNSAGYFALPDQYNVAVALTKAQIDLNPASTTYLIQNLDAVYTFADNRTYPLSSYSYMILPTGTDAQDSRFVKGTAKRQTLVDFLYYSICAGQTSMGPIGYSPLPVNLVQAGFDQIKKLKVTDPAVELTNREVGTCNNPTFIAGNPSRNYLAEIAPQPAACDKTGAGPCGAAVTNRPGGSTGGSSSGSGSGAQNGGAGNGASSGAGDGSGAGGGAGGTAGPQIDPDTGQVISAGGAGGGDVAGVPSDLAASDHSGLTGVLGPLAILELLGVIIIPVLVARRMTTRRRDQS